jgi:t-SNARE complex subunit (syntaxin)
MTQQEIERLAVLENEVQHIKGCVEKIDKTLTEFVLAVNEQREADKEAADKRYASKLTEKLVYGLVAIVLIGVAYLVLSHVGLPTP